jgi:hypothetical protein
MYELQFEIDARQLDFSNWIEGCRSKIFDFNKEKLKAYLISFHQ